MQTYAQKRVNVPGTKVSIVPPKGFTKTEGFAGFQKGDSSYVIVMTMEGSSYCHHEGENMKAEIEKKGIKILTYETMMQDGYEAAWFEIEGENKLRKCQFVFGDSTFTVLMTIFCPENDRSTYQAIKKSLSSVTYQKDKVMNPLAETFFILDDSVTRLKFTRFMANFYMYTLNGEKEPKKDAPMLMVIPLSGYSGDADILVKALLEKLGKQGIVSLHEVSRSTKKVNGYNALEVLLEGKGKAKPFYMLIQVIQQGERLVMIQGMKRGGKFDPDLFRELTQTIKFK